MSEERRRCLLEICCCDLDSVKAAVEGGADRIELCSGLTEGGLTPSYGLISAAVGFGIPVNVLIRPRGGDFFYSDSEVRIMREDIANAIRLGASGVVVGALESDGKVDVSLTRSFVECAQGKTVTFHRAIDLCSDPIVALEDIISAGCDTILTSGQECDALKGASNILKLRNKAAGRINVMAGCGVRPTNVAEILKFSGASAIHSTASSDMESLMQFRRGGVSMGGGKDEYSRRSTSSSVVKALREIIDIYNSLI